MKCMCLSRVFFYEELRRIWCYFFLLISIAVDLYLYCIHTVTMLRAQWLQRFEILFFYHSLLADWMLLNDTRVSRFNREILGPEAELQPTENDHKQRILD